MEHRAETIEFALSHQDTLRIRDGEGLVIEVVEDSLWLTQERDIKDYIVEAGQSMVIDRPGLTLASPCSAARLRVRKSGATCNAVIEIRTHIPRKPDNTFTSPSVPEYLQAAA